MEILTREMFTTLFPKEFVAQVLNNCIDIQKPHVNEDIKFLNNKKVEPGKRMVLIKEYYMTIEKKFPAAVTLEHWLANGDLVAKIKQVKLYKSQAEAFIDRSKSAVQSIEPVNMN